jgi:hypothetical protein
MEEFTQLFGNLLAFVYHCFDRIVIHGYLSGLSRPEQVVYFVREVLGLSVVSKEELSQRTGDYRDWVEVCGVTWKFAFLVGVPSARHPDLALWESQRRVV